MKVLSWESGSDLCAEGGWMGHILSLDEPVTREDILRLGAFGRLTYMSQMKQPFFLAQGGDFLMRGLEGDRQIKVGCKEHNIEALNKVISFIESD